MSLRQELASVYPGIFNGCNRVGDVKEFQVVKAKDSVEKEGREAGKKMLQVFICNGLQFKAYFSRLYLRGSD